MKTILCLPAKTHLKNYYVEFYTGEPTFANRVFFLAYYGQLFESEQAAKIRAFRSFCNAVPVENCTCIVLKECNGMQIANHDEPYLSKSAVVRVLARKQVN